MVSFQRKKNVNPWRVGFKIVATLIGLWASGYALNIVYNIMNATSSPFYKGLGLVGLSVQDVANGTIERCGTGAAASGYGVVNGQIPNCIVGKNDTSLLAIVGIIAVIWIIFEFVDVKF